MKAIEPFQIWKDGENKTASLLSAKIVNDNLSTSCTFYWNLFEEQPVDPEVPTGPSYVTLAEGNVDMNNEDYQNWDGSNDSAYLFVAEKINVTIVS